MYARILLLALLLSIITVNARHQGGSAISEDEDSLDERREVKDQPQRFRDVQRHRRKRWQSVYNGYDYRPPSISYYPNERRDFYNQPDLNDVLRLLDDIKQQLSRPPPPPPPPQPIYIPYLYPVPNTCQCTPRRNETVPAGGVPPRFPEMEDARQNWGIEKPKDDNDEENYNRPINFRPTQGQQSSTSSQGNKSRSSCDAVILLCCVPSDTHINRQLCFSNHDCSVTYTTNGCTQESIDGAIDRISKVYSPI